MKIITRIVILIIILIQLACTETTEKSDEINYNSLDWIIGNWERTNDDFGKRTFENWRKESAEIYVGEGFTLAEKDTIFKENLRLIKKDDIWNLEVSGVNESPTIFKFTKQSENSFSCQNRLNDFPKNIMYSFDNNILTAIISDDNNSIKFSFVKSN